MTTTSINTSHLANNSQANPQPAQHPGKFPFDLNAAATSFYVGMPSLEEFKAKCTFDDVQLFFENCFRNWHFVTEEVNSFAMKWFMAAAEAEYNDLRNNHPMYVINFPYDQMKDSLSICHQKGTNSEYHVSIVIGKFTGSLRYLEDVAAAIRAKNKVVVGTSVHASSLGGAEMCLKIHKRAFYRYIQDVKAAAAVAATREADVASIRQAEDQKRRMEEGLSFIESLTKGTNRQHQSSLQPAQPSSSSSPQQHAEQSRIQQDSANVALSHSKRKQEEAHIGENDDDEWERGTSRSSPKRAKLVDTRVIASEKDGTVSNDTRETAPITFEIAQIKRGDGEFTDLQKEDSLDSFGESFWGGGGGEMPSLPPSPSFPSLSSFPSSPVIPSELLDKQPSSAHEESATRGNIVLHGGRQAMAASNAAAAANTTIVAPSEEDVFISQPEQQEETAEHSETGITSAKKTTIEISNEVREIIAQFIFLVCYTPPYKDQEEEGSLQDQTGECERIVAEYAELSGKSLDDTRLFIGMLFMEGVKNILEDRASTDEARSVASTITNEAGGVCFEAFAETFGTLLENIEAQVLEYLSLSPPRENE